MFSVVCLCIINITENVMNGLQRNFMGVSGMVKGTSHLFFGSNPNHHADSPVRNQP